MKVPAVALLISALLIAPAYAQPVEGQLVTHGSYTNVSGHHVHRPSKSRSGGKPAGATAHCRDGSWSFSEHHSGTCSHHGGVAEWE
jgi:hypothetical protein